jgi:hypothetical protein
LRQHERRVAQPEQRLDGVATGGKEERGEEHQQVAGPPVDASGGSRAIRAFAAYLC